MQVSFRIKYDELDREIVETKTIEVEDDGASLINTLEDATGKQENWTFNAYYENTEVMLFDMCFPYILRGDKYEWVVPFDEVTIHDFICTHGLNEKHPVIKVEVEDYGGADELFTTDIINWIVFAWPLVRNQVITLGGLFTFADYVGKVVKYFTNKRNVRAIPDDVAEVINSKRRWTIEDLQSAFDIDDAGFVKTLLLCCGFRHKKGTNVYIRRKVFYRKIKKLQLEYISDCWGPSYNPCLEKQDKNVDVKETVQSINMVMTDIKMHSKMNNSDCFEIANHKVEDLISNYRCLKKGELFKPILVNEGPINEDLDTLAYELSETLTYLESLLIYLDEKEKANKQ